MLTAQIYLIALAVYAILHERAAIRVAVSRVLDLVLVQVAGRALILSDSLSGWWEALRRARAYTARHELGRPDLDKWAAILNQMNIDHKHKGATT